MPKWLHAKLYLEAKSRGYGKARTNRYVYGTLAKIKKRRRK